jgi:3-deoxy-D-manno-octulosonic-acid transferase
MDGMSESFCKANMTQFIYSCFIWALSPLLLLKLFLRARREPLYGQAVRERFGYYNHSVCSGALWIHAVSLGETRAVAALIAALRVAYPDVRLLLTHGTATGRNEGRQLLRQGDMQVWLPWDTPAAVKRFLRHFQPRVGVLIDTEVWPNLTAVAKQQGVPLVLANARLSERSWRQAQRWAALAYPAYSSLHDVWAQTEDDAQRLRDLGARVSAVMGNLKFDAIPNQQLLTLGQAWRSAFSDKPVVLLAISREGEEAILLQTLQQHGEYLQQAQWWIVPRHPQRFEEVAVLLQASGLSWQRRSQWPVELTNRAAPQETCLVLGDSLGEMPLYYGAASVALMGGSFAPLGGQNLIEACACGCPVVVGPHTFNFSQAVEWVMKAQAGLRCDDLGQAMAQALELAKDSSRQQRMTQAALAFANSHQGAVAYCVKALGQWLQKP